MKKIIIAITAMFAMTMSANAQSDNKQMNIDRLSYYLELTIDQQEPVKKALAQFNSSMEVLYNLKDQSKGLEAWQKIQARHKKTMSKILSESQYEKYVDMFELTAKNAAERLAEGLQASK